MSVQDINMLSLQESKEVASKYLAREDLNKRISLWYADVTTLGVNCIVCLTTVNNTFGATKATYSKAERKLDEELPLQRRREKKQVRSSKKITTKHNRLIDVMLKTIRGDEFHKGAG